jgi:hypothetical protein
MSLHPSRGHSAELLDFVSWRASSVEGYDREYVEAVQLLNRERIDDSVRVSQRSPLQRATMSTWRITCAVASERSYPSRLKDGIIKFPDRHAQADHPAEALQNPGL